MTSIGTMFKWNKRRTLRDSWTQRQVIYYRQKKKEKKGKKKKGEKKNKSEEWRTWWRCDCGMSSFHKSDTYLSLSLFSLNCDLHPHLHSRDLLPPFVSAREWLFLNSRLYRAHPIWMHYVPQCRNQRTNFHTDWRRESLFIFFFHPHIGSFDAYILSGGGNAKNIVKSTLAIFRNKPYRVGWYLTA